MRCPDAGPARNSFIQTLSPVRPPRRSVLLRNWASLAQERRAVSYSRLGRPVIQKTLDESVVPRLEGPPAFFELSILSARGSAYDSRGAIGASWDG